MRLLVIPQGDLAETYNVTEKKQSRLTKVLKLNFEDLEPLNPKQKLIKTNPSLILVANTHNSCVYKMVYRALYPTVPLGNNENLTKPRQYPFKTSMWDSGWDSKWSGLGSCFLTVYDNGRLVISHDTISPEYFSYNEDARIYKENGTYNIIFNTYTYYQHFPGAGKVLKGCKSYKTNDSLCIVMMKQKVDITEPKMKPLGDPIVLCKDKHQRYEKNWAPVAGHNGLMQYSFIPRLKFLKQKKCNCGCGCDCKSIDTERSDFFMSFWQEFRDVLDPLRHVGGICSSTPLISWGSNTLIGLGHIKIKYENLKLYVINKKVQPVHLFRFLGKLAKDLNLEKTHPHNWADTNMNLNPAARYIYFSFFYTIRKDNLELDKFSPAFIPRYQSLPFVPTIVFPMSIQKFIGTQYIISQGISDINCGLMIMERREIKMLLKYNNNSEPAKWNFRYLQ